MSNSGYVRVGGKLYPTVTDEQGTTRFIENPIVRFLVDHGVLDLQVVAVAYQTNRLGPPSADLQRAYAEFNMMLGYSLGGFMELSSFMDMDVEQVSPLEALAIAGGEE